MGFFDRIFHRGSTAKGGGPEARPASKAPEPEEPARKDGPAAPAPKGGPGAEARAPAAGAPDAKAPAAAGTPAPATSGTPPPATGGRAAAPGTPPPAGSGTKGGAAPAKAGEPTRTTAKAPAGEPAPASSPSASSSSSGLPAASPASLAGEAARLRKPTNGVAEAPPEAGPPRTPPPTSTRTTAAFGAVRAPLASSSSGALPAARARPAAPASARPSTEPASPSAKSRPSAVTPAPGLTPAPTPAPAKPAPTPAPATPTPAAPAPALSAEATPTPTPAPKAQAAPSPPAEGLGGGDGPDLDLDSLIDAAIDGTRMDLEDGGRPNGRSEASRPSMSAADAAAARETFEAVLGEHLFQLRGLALELRFGPASSRWLAPAIAEVKSLRKMSEAMEMDELNGALDTLGAALEDARRVADVSIEGPARDRLLRACDALARAVPSAFKLDDEQLRREVIVVDELLRRVAGIDDWAIQRVHSAGLARLEQFLQGRAEDLAAVSGIDRELAAAVVASFQDYRRECPSMLAAIDRADEMRKLGAVVRELEGLQQAFERVSQRWSDEDRAAKRKLQRQREAAWGRARLVMARLGAVDRLARLEIRRYADRIEDLGEMLRSGAAPPVAAPAPRAEAS
jgi:hypothetical protein